MSRIYLAGCYYVVFVLVATRASSADPDYYLRKQSWQDTLLASLARLDSESFENGFAGFESGILRGGDPARFVSVDVSGVAEMYLLVTGDPDVRWGVATWADAQLVKSDGEIVSLTKLETWKSIRGRSSVDITLRAGLYQKLSIAGRGFERGVHVQADSVVRVPLDGAYERFEAWIGVDDWAGENGHVRFRVTGKRGAAIRGLWDLLERDFPEGPDRRQMDWVQQDRIFNGIVEPDDLSTLAMRFARASRRIAPLAQEALRLAGAAYDRSRLDHVASLYFRSREIASALAEARAFRFEGLRMAIDDLTRTFGDRYSSGPRYAERLSLLEAALPAALRAIHGGTLETFLEAERLARKLFRLRDEALLANPLLDFDRLLVIRRTPIGDPRRNHWEEKGLGEFIGLPRQSSWGVSQIPRPDDWDNEICVLSPVRPEGELRTLFHPQGRKLVTDVDLHFDGDRLLFSMPDHQNRWQIYELDAAGAGLTQLTAGDQPGVHCYDACYLPGGQIVFISTAVLQGVPCNPSVIVGMAYRMDGDGSNIRQICFEQDHDYCPTVLNDGRVLYLRWDYTDTPHIWNRLLMSMNPDGTGQREYYGSNSYWPNAIFFARPVPNHSTRIVGIVTGHHEGRVGELVIFDPLKGRHEADGVVQRIPGRGEKVKPILEDKLTEHTWPKFVHPYPLSDKYFLVACKPHPDALWGIYLVDVFDNMVLVREEEHHVLLEPIPFRTTRRPPVIPDSVQLGRKDAMVYLSDVYRGAAMSGIPRGSVKNLRVFTYHFGYQKLAGIDHRVGADGPWEVKRVLGTVPVESDGSAFFRIPARTPVSIQPLDEDGMALALMRSWMTAMPGEVLSCAGCHEEQGTSVPNQGTKAIRRAPSELKPWYGPVRGFSFRREVQPVLDRYCVSCHNGQPGKDGSSIPDLRDRENVFVVYERGDPEGRLVEGRTREELVRRYGGVFEPSYVELRRYVRTGGLESDLHVLPPKEFHANTSELIQMLQKGHHDVQLDREAWDRLVTWIDLNTPCHGTWSEVARISGNQRERRLALRRLYGGVDEDAEQIPDFESPERDVVPLRPRVEAEPAVLACAGWPLTASEARQRQAAGGPVTRTIALGGGVTMEFVRIPAGAFAMGDLRGEHDEAPMTRVEIPRSFWLGRYEVTNEQYEQFDPAHDSRFEHRSSWIFSEAYLGWPLNRPRQPVVRVSWNRAAAFCEWLSERAGVDARLPTEAQWEYACRAGTDSPLSYGDLDADFSSEANMADVNLRELAYEGWRPKAPDLVVRDDRFDDGALVTTDVGNYQPNAWDLHDMHGNAAEWTRSEYLPYPYREGARGDRVQTSMVVRGGSWRDRPARCRSSFRVSYPAYQRVFNVGFRVVIEE